MGGRHMIAPSPLCTIIATLRLSERALFRVAISSRGSAGVTIELVLRYHHGLTQCACPARVFVTANTTSGISDSPHK